jgi:hypothetical protein
VLRVVATRRRRRAARRGADRLAEISSGQPRQLADYARGDADRGLPVARDRVLPAAMRDLPLDRPATPRIPFLVRTQGPAAEGNPRRVRSLVDVAKKGFGSNRQPGSGTRAIVDALLARDAIAPSRIVGYGNEEFTHAAGAATVASGGADVGFGVEAARR